MRGRRRKARRQRRLILGFLILIVAFGLGSTIGISMGFNGNEGNVVQNNTTHMPIDVTHNISLYENRSLDDFDDTQSSSSNGVVQYSGNNSNSNNYYGDSDNYESDSYNYDEGYDSSYDSGEDYQYYETDGYSEDYSYQTTDVDASEYY